MEKEDILARSRREGFDEGTKYARSKGRRIGVATLCAMFVILTLFNFWKGQDNSQVFAIFWSYLGFECYGRYQLTQQKALLVGSVMGILAGVLYAAGYLIGVLR